MADTMNNANTHDVSIFKGKLVKVRIESNCICYGPCPEPKEEVEQHLTINAEGRVWLTRISFGNGNIEEANFKADNDRVKSLLDIIEQRFSSDYEEFFVTDIGMWNMILTNDKGEEFIFTGSLLEDERSAVFGLSDMIRETVNRDDLFAFDGNPDKITELIVEYTRDTKIRPKKLPENADFEFARWIYSETITINRKEETLINHIQFAEAASVTNKYHVEAGIRSLLDELYPEIFDDIIGNPEDVLDDPMNQRSYRLIIRTKHGEEKVIEGSYDKYGLPEEWPDFIDKIYGFMAFYGIGEIFEEDYYNRPKRRKSDFIYYDVEFEAGGKTYCYLGDDSHEVGDTVLVPAGKDNHEALVRIVDKNYYSAENAPFPVERAKHIIRRIDEDEIDRYLQKEDTMIKKSRQEGYKSDGSLTISYEDYDVDCYDGADVEATYTLDAENVEKLREYLKKKYTGTVESMLIQECGPDYKKRSLSELFDTLGIKYEKFVWVSN